MKACTKCKTEKPNTSEYFQFDNKDREILCAICKVCRHKQQAKWRAANKKRIKKTWAEQGKRYYENSKKNNFLSIHFSRYKASAKRRNITFSISKKDFETKVKGKCYLCGENGNPYNGLDRIYNTRGYYKSNVKACCEWCNKFKSDHSLEETLKHVEKISKYQKKKAS